MGEQVAVIPSGGPLDFGRMDAQLFSTFPKGDRARVVALMQGQAEPLVDMAGKEITVCHILAHTVERIDDKTGEVSALLRIVLAGPNGEAWQTTSNGIRDSIRLLAKFYGLPPWPEGIKVAVQQIKTRRGFKTYALSPV